MEEYEKTCSVWWCAAESVSILVFSCAHTQTVWDMSALLLPPPLPTPLLLAIRCVYIILCVHGVSTNQQRGTSADVDSAVCVCVCVFVYVCVVERERERERERHYVTGTPKWQQVLQSC